MNLSDDYHLKTGVVHTLLKEPPYANCNINEIMLAENIDQGLLENENYCIGHSDYFRPPPNTELSK